MHVMPPNQEEFIQILCLLIFVSWLTFTVCKERETKLFETRMALEMEGVDCMIVLCSPFLPPPSRKEEETKL